MNKYSLLVLVCCLGIISACHNGTSNNGGDTAGNGGDEVAMDFIAASRRAAEYLALNPELVQRVSLGRLRSVIENMDVRSTDSELTIRGVTKTAINYPALTRVEINRPRWKSNDAEIKPALALHECLGLLRIADQNYILSSELLELDPTTLKPLRGQSDILIVVDDSGSMEAHQADLSRNVDYLWDKIRQRRLNFRIAVTTSSVENFGRFVGSVKIITPHTPHGLDVLRSNIRVGTRGNVSEQFFGPIRDGLSSPDNGDFLRPSANLELIFLTDAEDQTPNLDPESFAKYLWSLKGDPKKVFAYGILPLMPNAGCGLDDGPQVRLTKFVSLVHGDLHNLCNLSSDVPSAIGAEIVKHVVSK